MESQRLSFLNLNPADNQIAIFNCLERIKSGIKVIHQVIFEILGVGKSKRIRLVGNYHVSGEWLPAQRIDMFPISKMWNYISVGGN